MRYIILVPLLALLVQCSSSGSSMSASECMAERNRCMRNCSSLSGQGINSDLNRNQPFQEPSPQWNKQSCIEACQSRQCYWYERYLLAMAWLYMKWHAREDANRAFLVFIQKYSSLIYVPGTNLAYPVEFNLKNIITVFLTLIILGSISSLWSIQGVKKISNQAINS